MCRHLAYLGPPRTLASLLHEPSRSLELQSWKPALQREGAINADGWGVGWWDPAVRPEPARYRTAAPMWTVIACCVRTVPVLPEPGSSAPDSRIMMPVALQIRSVSMNTPSACTKPCDDG